MRRFTTRDLMGNSPAADMLLAVVGPDSAEKLCQAYGGTTVYIPSTVSMKDSHWLVDVIGRDDAEKLCEHIRTGDAGMHFTIPRRLIGSESPLLAIRKMTLEGHSAAACARELGIAQRTVWRWRARLKKTQKRVHAKAIRRYIEQGWSDDSIAKKLDVFVGTVVDCRHELRRAGKL